MQSSIVTAGDDIKTSEYNNLRADAPVVGLIALWPDSTPPASWLICDGSGIDTTTYADLFAVIAYTFGGAGSTFNLPDMEERFPFGKSGSYPIGTTGGGSITLITANLPSHSHSITTEPAHQHYTQTGGATAGTRKWLGYSATPGVTQVSNTGGSHSHTGASGSTGSSNSIIILPTYLGLYYIIRY